MSEEKKMAKPFQVERSKMGIKRQFTQVIDTMYFEVKRNYKKFILMLGFYVGIFLLFYLLNETQEAQGVETPDDAEEREMSTETVLCETKKIDLNGRKINTRVVEERAFEWDEDDWVLIEISKNWFAICKETGDVYYFGEDSLDCPDGFEDDDTCEGGGDPAGSWEAGVDGAKPGIMMPGTFLLGAKYFQEVAPPAAVDRGENVAMGRDWPEKGEPEYTGCVQIFDTNPAEGGEACGEDDAKTYCYGVGLVQDQDLGMIDSDYEGCDKDDDDDDDD